MLASDTPSGPVVLDKPVNHLDEIDALADHITRASPSGAVTIAARIKDHVAALRGGPDNGVFATKHESLVADDTLSGARSATEVERSGVALPAGVSIHNRSEDGVKPPVPVAPARPEDVDEALQTGKSVASPVVVQQPAATVQTGISADAKRKAQEDKANSDAAKAQAERDQEQRDLAAADQDARLAPFAPDHASPNPGGTPVARPSGT